MGWTVCNNDTCIKSKECLRFINKEGTEILFKNICPNHRERKYYWFRKNETSIQTVDENIEKEVSM